MAQRSPRRDQENQLCDRRFERVVRVLDLIRELPSGPAACEPHQRPHTCPHPTARCTDPEDFSCVSRGVHTCRKVVAFTAH